MRSRPARRPIVLVLLSFASLDGCHPEIDEDAARIRTPRLLAVRAEPAEARPNEKVTLIALYTDGERAVDEQALGWTFCAARRALAEPGPVDPACLAGTAVSPIGFGSRAVAVVPRDTCRIFGPDRPLGNAGEPAGRPADPDGTGGYFQPGFVSGPGIAPALFELRVRCALPSATQQIALDFGQRYRPNENPIVASVIRIHERSAETLAPDGELRLRRGTTVRLRVTWPDCPDSAPCAGAERYVSYDAATRKVVDRRESITASWLTTRGRLALPRTGRGEADLVTSTENDFTAPPDVGPASLFIVLRDDRGGVAFRSIAVRVE